MRVLITGAAGMVGRKLTERLMKDGKLEGGTITALCTTWSCQQRRPRAAFGRHDLGDLSEHGDPAACSRPSPI